MVLLKFELKKEVFNFVCIVRILFGFCIDILRDVFIYRIILLDFKIVLKDILIDGLDKYFNGL